jgi:hypothetical protein
MLEAMTEIVADRGLYGTTIGRRVLSVFRPGSVAGTHALGPRRSIMRHVYPSQPCGMRVPRARRRGGPAARIVDGKVASAG